MAYEDTKCPCGDSKPTDTFLCDACVAHFVNRRELAEYQDRGLHLDFRRNAAVLLVTLSRCRKRAKESPLPKN